MRGWRAPRHSGGSHATRLRRLWAHDRRGYDHDGRFATLRDVIDATLHLGLAPADEDDLEQYLRSL